jgi:thioredoxin reductase
LSTKSCQLCLVCIGFHSKSWQLLSYSGYAFQLASVKAIIARTLITAGAEIVSRTVVLAVGVAYRRLGIAGLDDLIGAGVFYGAVGSEAVAMKDQDVFVVGGGNSAGQAAVYLARYARQVTMVVRGESLAATTCATARLNGSLRPWVKALLSSN